MVQFRRAGQVWNAKLLSVVAARRPKAVAEARTAKHQGCGLDCPQTSLVPSWAEPAGAEICDGYLWSPKRNANGARDPFYESIREVSPGNIRLFVRGHADRCHRGRTFLLRGESKAARVRFSRSELAKRRLDGARSVRRVS